MKQFDVPAKYRSPIITALKNRRKQEDRLKKDFTPTLLDIGRVQFHLARHFGFCYGVENAIDIAFKTVSENPGRRIYLLSEMIHNPQVNKDLQDYGIRFLQDNMGQQLISFDALSAEDIVIIPAFGTTLPIESLLKEKGIPIEKYNTTCPFVEKVWNRGEQIAAKGYSIVIHGKPLHEETRATFSHAAANAPSVIVNDLEDAQKLAGYITGENNPADFYTQFKGRYSEGFDIERDLQKFGVVNQTTQLATDTQAIADYLKSVVIRHYGLTAENIEERFADTRDTLCYATNDNQTAVKGMLEVPADLALVVGGYNSSNTTHLVELCEEKLPTYFIESAENILSASEIRHYDFHSRSMVTTPNFLSEKKQIRIALSSGASCPDALVEEVLHKVAALTGGSL